MDRELNRILKTPHMLQHLVTRQPAVRRISCTTVGTQAKDVWLDGKHVRSLLAKLPVQVFTSWLLVHQRKGLYSGRHKASRHCSVQQSYWISRDCCLLLLCPLPSFPLPLVVAEAFKLLEPSLQMKSFAGTIKSQVNGLLFCSYAIIFRCVLKMLLVLWFFIDSSYIFLFLLLVVFFTAY